MPEDERGDRELVGKAMLAGQREVEARAMAALMGVAAEAVAILAKVPLAMAVAAEVGGVMEEAIVAGGTAACMVVVQRVAVRVAHEECSRQRPSAHQSSCIGLAQSA